MSEPTQPSATVCEPERYRDKEVVDLYPFRDLIQRARVFSLATEELVAEHRANPLGIRPNFHSAALQEVLGYFRSHPSDGRYVACRTGRGPGWGIAVTREGRAPSILADREFETLDDARHAAFLIRVGQLRAEMGED